MFMDQTQLRVAVQVRRHRPNYWSSLIHDLQRSRPYMPSLMSFIYCSVPLINQCVHSLKVIEAAARLLSEMRTTIKPPVTSVTARLVAGRSAERLGKCITAIRFSKGLIQDLAQVAGVSSNELVRQCCEATDNSVEHNGGASQQFVLLCSIYAHLDRPGPTLDIFLDALIDNHFVTFLTLHILNAWVLDKSIAGVGEDAVDEPVVQKLRDFHAHVLCILFERAHEVKRLNVSPAIEAVHTNTMFLLEACSHSAIEREDMDFFGSVSLNHNLHIVCTAYTNSHR